jgi:hypothetical protein
MDGRKMNSWFNYLQSYQEKSHNGNIREIQSEFDQKDLKSAAKELEDLIKDELERLPSK